MLWRPDDRKGDPDYGRFEPYMPYVLSEDETPVQVKEYCLGAGAHTHYWDETAPRVIRDLDRLIACDDLDRAQNNPPDPAPPGSTA